MNMANLDTYSYDIDIFDYTTDHQHLLCHDDSQFQPTLDHWSGMNALLNTPRPHEEAPNSDYGRPSCSDEIEGIYTELHRCVDQVVARVCSRTPPLLDQIKEQNRRVLSKLITLENAITRERDPASPSPVSPGQCSVQHQYASIAPAVYPPPSSNSTTTTSPSITNFAPSPASSWQSSSSSINMVPITTTTPTTTTTTTTTTNRRRTRRRASEGYQSPLHKSVSAGGVEGRGQGHHSNKLIRKFLLIGDQDSRVQVAEFAAQMYNNALEQVDNAGGTDASTFGPQLNLNHPRQVPLPNAHHFSNALSEQPQATLTSGGTSNAAIAAAAVHNNLKSSFMQLVLNLGVAIESSAFGEQNSRIKRRIALAHFYHAYTLAQENPDLFLSWCQDKKGENASNNSTNPKKRSYTNHAGPGNQHNSRNHNKTSSTSSAQLLLPKGGNKSMVQHRFAELIFCSSRGGGVMMMGEKEMMISSRSPLAATDDETKKRRIAKIQMWRKMGKKWAQIIQRFGCGILLLLPASLSDEDLRVAHDNVIASGLDLIESRRHLFADVLSQANDLLEAHFFPSPTSTSQYGLAGDYTGTTTATTPAADSNGNEITGGGTAVAGMTAAARMRIGSSPLSSTTLTPGSMTTTPIAGTAGGSTTGRLVDSGLDWGHLLNDSPIRIY